MDERSELHELVNILQKFKYLAPGPVQMILKIRDYPNLRSMFEFVDDTVSFLV